MRWTRPPAGTGRVYALVDPRTDETRYIGQSVQPLGVRLGGHRKHPSPRIRKWLDELRIEGLDPQIVVVRDHVPYADLDHAEQEAIAAAGLEGKRLLNIMFAGGTRLLPETE
ncbi:hypothetical protein ABZY20_25625 [Streptomyces sp. NPDC006624]|uniref:hypothetical protein n=1 Tax=Streptomyces sp. NPDC006624 TaxID=3154892 RepID=UPI0033BD3B07